MNVKLSHHDPATKLRIQQHFLNFDDKITDEDLLRVRTEFSNFKAEADDATPIKGMMVSDVVNENKNTTRAEGRTPWDILGGE